MASPLNARPNSAPTVLGIESFIAIARAKSGADGAASDIPHHHAFRDGDFPKPPDVMHGGEVRAGDP
jgi:hypothetical protein